MKTALSWNCAAPMILNHAAAQPRTGRKVRGTIHWVWAADAVPAEVRLYDTLFLKEFPEDVEEGQRFLGKSQPRIRWKSSKIANLSPAWPKPQWRIVTSSCARVTFVSIP